MECKRKINNRIIILILVSVTLLIKYEINMTPIATQSINDMVKNESVVASLFVIPAIFFDLISYTVRILTFCIEVIYDIILVILVLWNERVCSQSNLDEKRKRKSAIISIIVTALCLPILLGLIVFMVYFFPTVPVWASITFFSNIVVMIPAIYVAAIMIRQLADNKEK